MNLIELIAKNFTEWPERDKGDYNVKWLVQHGSGEISGWENDGELTFRDEKWDILRSCPVDYYGNFELAEDYSTARVTFEEWEAYAGSPTYDVVREAAIREMRKAEPSLTTRIAGRIYDAGYRKFEIVEEEV